MSVVSSFQKMMHVAIAGMEVQKERLLVVAQNLANIGSRAPAKGVDPYQRKTITFASEMDAKKGVEVVKIKRIDRDPSPFPMIYSPHDPAANEDGFVAESNVKGPIEMTDSMEAKRGYQANLKAYEKILSMQQEAISLIKNTGR